MFLTWFTYVLTWIMAMWQWQHIPLLSFSCLSYFRLWGCPKMTCMPLFSNLEGLDLTRTSFKPLQQTITMTMNKIGGASSFLSSSSSSSSPPFSKLKQLRLWMMQDLESLPVEWSKNLTSLEELEILECHNLMSLPERWVISPFYTLWKSSNVPHLEQKCHKEIEEDWTDISHIPKLSLRWKGCLIWEKFKEYASSGTFFSVSFLDFIYLFIYFKLLYFLQLWYCGQFICNSRCIISQAQGKTGEDDPKLIISLSWEQMKCKFSGNLLSYF